MGQGQRPKKANGLFVYVEGILSKNQAKKRIFSIFKVEALIVEFL